MNTHKSYLILIIILLSIHTLSLPQTATLTYDGDSLNERDLNNTVLYVHLGGGETFKNPSLLTNSDTIFAFVENPSALLTSDAPLAESTLDSRTLYINLSEEYFINGINMSHFTLVNTPPGLSIYSLTRPSNTQAILDLQFNGNDFDIPITNFAVDINFAYLYSTE